MFTIESRRDIGMVNQALKKNWDVDKDKIKAALMACLTDPELAVEAAKVLLAADAIDQKREEARAKKEAKDNELRLRLLAVAQSVPVAELARIASENGIVSGSNQGRRTDAST